MRLNASLLVLLCAFGISGPAAAPADVPAPPEDVLKTLKVPDGFVVERVAASPLVERPMLAAFDDVGRLYVCDSAGVNLKGAELAKQLPHSIKRLEDTDGDGVFDKSVVFADKLVFPQGVCWYDGAVYCSSPPSFWKLTDTDNDGIADQREELVTGFANTGVGDDMHGASAGPDGRIYWCAGRFPHEIRKPGGPVIHKGTAPLLLRCRPDGSDVEVVCGLQGNAVGVAFSPEGDCFASGTFLAPDSMGAGLRDALIHCVDGGEYPVRDRVLKEHKRTGDLLPPLTHLGVSASSDLCCYRSDVLGLGLGAEYHGNLFSCAFNFHKVFRHVLEPDGATYRCRNEDFLTSTSADFHPTDVLEDADGSLLVIDTGAWFRIGCPTSKIAKPQVLGGIYRIRRKGVPRISDPRGAKLKWENVGPEELARRLDDLRPAVVERAARSVESAGGEPGDVLLKPLAKGTPAARRAAAWALARHASQDSRDLLRLALSSEDPRDRQTAARAAGLIRDADAAPALIKLITREQPAAVRREAAGALGRMRHGNGIPHLLEALRGEQDRFLQHAIIYALIQIGGVAETRKGLADADLLARRGALIALDQMDGGDLKPADVIPLLDPADPVMRDTALWVMSHHPDWGAQVLSVFPRELSVEQSTFAQREVLRQTLLAFARDDSVQQLIARKLKEDATPVQTRLLLLEVIAQGAGGKLPAAWAEAIEANLGHADERVVRQAVLTARSAVPEKGSALVESLLKLAADAGKPEDLRAAALAAVVARVDRLEAGQFDFLIACLDVARPALLRSTAADALGRARLDAEQLTALAASLGKAGPIEVPALLGAFERSSDAQVGRKLLASLEAIPAGKGLRPEGVREALKGYPPDVRQAAEPLLGRLAQGAREQQAKLAGLEPALAGGDVGRGRELFFGNKAACSTCHTVGGTGGKVGPDLSKIAKIRTGRDLLEAVVYPSASFARGFEPYLLKTTDGDVRSGIIARETADAVILFDGQRVEVRVPRSMIKEVKPGPVSIMPEGLDAQLSRGEMADLMAFLQSLK